MKNKKIIITESQLKRLKEGLDGGISDETSLLTQLKDEVNRSLISATKFSNTPKGEGDRYYSGVIDALETVIGKIEAKINSSNGDDDYYHDEIHGY